MREVSKEPHLAVDLARLSLWLFVGDDGLPWSFAERTLRHGDSLVGLTLEQLQAFHWSGGEPRDRLVELAGDPKRRDDARLVADVLVGAFFDSRTSSEREQERQRRFGDGSRKPFMPAMLRDTGSAGALTRRREKFASRWNYPASSFVVSHEGA